jgi:hypothetical protein
LLRRGSEHKIIAAVATIVYYRMPDTSGAPSVNAALPIIFGS